MHARGNCVRLPRQKPEDRFDDDHIQILKCARAIGKALLVARKYAHRAVHGKRGRPIRSLLHFPAVSARVHVDAAANRTGNAVRKFKTGKPEIAREDCRFAERLASSRFDFSIMDGNIQSFLEVKGVTLEQDGIALFPDAPTLRGVKHLQELTACQQAEIPAYLLLVMQMKEIRAFRPNDAMHPQFGEALRRAAAAGVTLLARDCIVTPDSITIDAPVPIQL